MLRRIDLDSTPMLLAGALVLGLVIQLALPQASPLADVAPGSIRPLIDAGSRPLGDMQVRPAVAPAFTAILDRPLFSPSRSGTAAVAGDIAPLGALALLGVASDGGRASATLVAPGGPPRSLRLGETIQGWRLSGVGRDHALLSRGGLVQVIEVGAPAQAPVGAPATPAAAPSGAAPL